MANMYQVGLVVEKDTFKEKGTQKLKDALTSCDSIKESDASYFFIWDLVRWNLESRHVQIVTKFVDENKETSGLLVVGAEGEETWGRPYELDMYIDRRVGIPFSVKELKLEEFFTSNAEKFIKDIPE